MVLVDMRNDFASACPYPLSAGNFALIRHSFGLRMVSLTHIFDINFLKNQPSYFFCDVSVVLHNHYNLIVSNVFCKIR